MGEHVGHMSVGPFVHGAKNRQRSLSPAKPVISKSIAPQARSASHSSLGQMAAQTQPTERQRKPQPGRGHSRSKHRHHSSENQAAPRTAVEIVEDFMRSPLYTIFSGQDHHLHKEQQG